VSMSEIIARQLDHELYDHPGRETTVTIAIRKYQDRPALKVGDKVTVVRFARVEGQYGGEPRLLVRNTNGVERWIPATNVSLGDEINAESAPLTESDLHSLHRAGLGMYRPQGGSTIEKCDRLVKRGLLGRNPSTGIYFLTDAGSDALAEQGR
jgi:hypothetical protein